MIFLTGFMGSGKTTVGRRVSELLDRPFLDLDEYIMTKTGCKINEIFACVGEQAFRSIECEALKEIASKHTNTIVSTGGGLPVNPANRLVMKACGRIIYLRASFENLAARIPDDSMRPLWNESASALLKKRTSAYEDADYIVDTDDISPQDVANKISDIIKHDLEPIPVLVPNASYPIYIGKDIFKDLKKYISRHSRPEGILVLVDEQVFSLYQKQIQSVLSGIRHKIINVPSGESSKSFKQLMKLLEHMFSAHANRQWLCMAIGGGVTGDLAAFASSIYMRGIPVIQVPTTLLAQVDSSIGGKTGIDVKHGKNLVGTFHQPIFVLSDIDFFSTLETEHLKDAMSEVIKYGIIMDKELFAYLEETTEPDYEKIVRLCTRDKAYVVSNDEKEGSLRRILNFGHTIGHAIEHSQNYNMSHGRAVAGGMYFTIWLSKELGLIDIKLMERIFRLIKKWTYPVQDIPYPSQDEIESVIAVDKKGTKDGIHFVLTPAIGDVNVKKLTSSQILGAYGRFARECKESL